MKTTLGYLLLASLVLWTGYAAAGNSVGIAAKPKLATSTWALDSSVKVYFIANTFSPLQKDLVWQGVTDWTRLAQRSALSIPEFVDAGEVRGLIDCVNCLTVTFQKAQTNNWNNRSSFNSLRRDQNGRLVSAWIGVDDEVKNSKLRELIYRALERGAFGAK